MVKMITLKQQELDKGHLRGQRIVSMYRRTPCSRWKSPTTAPCLNVVRKYGNRIFLQGRRNNYMEKEPWNWQRAGQLPPCKPDEGKGNKSLGPVMDIWMLTTKTATCSNPPSPDWMSWTGNSPCKERNYKSNQNPPARWEIIKAIRIWNCTPTQHPIIDSNNNWTQHYSSLSSTPSSMPGATPPAPLAAARSMAPWCEITLILFSRLIVIYSFCFCTLWDYIFPS